MTNEKLNEKLKQIGQVTLANTKLMISLAETVSLLAAKTLPLAGRPGDAAPVLDALRDLQVLLNGMQAHIDAAMKDVQGD